MLEKPSPQYKSCIDFLYLFWKALDFEQMFEFINKRDEHDTISKLVEYINEQNNQQYNEDGQEEEHTTLTLCHKNDKNKKSTFKNYEMYRDDKVNQKKFESELSEGCLID